MFKDDMIVAEVALEQKRLQVKPQNVIQKRLSHVSRAIGHTPLAKVYMEYKGEERIIFAKLENYNLTGSIKDRMALHIIKKSYESGDLVPGDEIVEATSGNTGIAFSALASALGHTARILCQIG